MDATLYGNPSGMHAVAREAKDLLEDARMRAAALIGAEPSEIIFTSGGTESDNLAVLGVPGTGSIVGTKIEHHAVLDALRSRTGTDVRLAEPGRGGTVDPASVAALVDESTVLVTVMLANNETGVVQPIEAIAGAVGRANSSTLIHTDAVQAFGTVPCDVGDLGVDLLSLSAHKFGGPLGAGLLYVRSGIRLNPIMYGGGQERGLRSGTQNVPAIVGMVAAMDAVTEDRERFTVVIRTIRDAFERYLSAAIEDMEIIGAESERLPQHSHVRFPGIRNDLLLIRLDRAGVAASAGSACQSGATTVSHVLTAMGYVAAEVREAVRFTFGWTSTVEDAERAAMAVVEAVRSAR